MTMHPEYFHHKQSRTFSCPICNEILTLGGLGTKSHFMKHVREREITKEQAFDFNRIFGFSLSRKNPT